MVDVPSVAYTLATQAEEMAASGQLDVLAETTTLMDRWNRECFLGSATPIDILVKLCEVSSSITQLLCPASTNASC